MSKKFILGTLLMVVFVFTFLINVSEVHAKSYGCKGNKQAIRQCLKTVIKGLEQEKADLETARQNLIQENNELQDAVRDGKIINEESEKGCDSGNSIVANLSGAQTSVGLSQENKEKINAVTAALNEQIEILTEVTFNFKGNTDQLIDLANGFTTIKSGMEAAIIALKNIK